MRFQKTIYVLIVANMVPLLGVLFFDWSVFQLILLYWFETLIIGFYNIIKMFWVYKWVSIITVPLFSFHFGFFAVGHLFFILLAFSPERDGARSFLPSQESLIALSITLVVPAVIFLTSHGISFYKNFIKNKEYKKLGTNDLMSLPYKRVALMHILLILGGGATIFLGQNIYILTLFILFKIVLDVRSHKKEHSF